MGDKYRVRPKTEVYGIEVNGAFQAYRAVDLEDRGRIEDSVGGARTVIERDPSGEVNAVNLDNGEEILVLKMLWFAWYAFHPETGLYAQ
ncbi:hypothetical protein ACFLTJ_02910 [Chloroflexota bacterium]